jgi:hypothetical protein
MKRYDFEMLNINQVVVFFNYARKQSFE